MKPIRCPGRLCLHKSCTASSCRTTLLLYRHGPISSIHFDGNRKHTLCPAADECRLLRSGSIQWSRISEVGGVSSRTSRKSLGDGDNGNVSSYSASITGNRRRLRPGMNEQRRRLHQSCRQMIRALPDHSGARPCIAVQPAARRRRVVYWKQIRVLIDQMDAP